MLRRPLPVEIILAASISVANRSQIALVVFGYRKLIVQSLCLVVGFALVGCADSRGGSIPYDVGHFTAPDPVAAVTAENAYRTGLGDTVSIVVMRVPDLSGDATIDPSGNITMPLIGKVAAMGKTTDQLANDIAGRLSAKYLQNPEVRVALKASSSQHITMDGAVGAPGIYPVPGQTTLVQAIALAHGTSPDANSRKVAIFRMINGRRQAAAFDLTDIRRGKAADPEVFANDIVIVDSSASKARFGKLLSTLPLLTVFSPVLKRAKIATDLRVILLGHQNR